MKPIRYKKAKHVTLVGAWINALLGIIKIVVGYFTYSYALLADGVHSLSDLLTDAVVVLAAKFGSKKPDSDHPYGHGRIETIATIVVALLITIVGLSIAYDACYTLIVLHDSKRPEFTAIIIAGLGLAIKEWLYHYTLNVANKIDSNLLRASAWHHRSDVFVSLVVLIGIVGAFLGFTYLDAIAALLVGALIVKIGAKMTWHSAKELVDTGVDEQTLQYIREEINAVPGVDSLHQLRTRLLAGMIFVDAHILVNKHISVSEGHYISEQVRLRLLKNFKKIRDVTVHIDPEDDEKMAPSVNLPNREHILKLCRSTWQSLPGFHEIKKINLHYLNGKIEIEIFFPFTLTHTTNPDELVNVYSNSLKQFPDIIKIKIYFEKEQT